MHDVGERLLDQIAIDLGRDFHVLVGRIGAHAETNDLGETQDVKAIDEQRMCDAEKQFFGSGIHDHKSPVTYHSSVNASKGGFGGI